MTLVEDAVPGADRTVALVAGARRGDAAAFAALYEEHHLRVHRLCRSMLGNDDDAADATQEAFLRAWRALGDVHDNHRFGPWLRSIATNVALDVLRGRRRTVVVDELERVRPPVDPGSAVTEVVGDVEALGAALQRLAPRHREILHLREFAGWSYERIAAEQQLELSAVKSLLWRARQSLRREFLTLTSGSLGLAFAWLVRGFRRQVARPSVSSGRVSQLAAELAGSGGAMAAAVVTTAVLPVLAGTTPEPTPVVRAPAMAVVQPAPPVAVTTTTVRAPVALAPPAPTVAVAAAGAEPEVAPAPAPADEPVVAAPPTAAPAEAAPPADSTTAPEGADADPAPGEGHGPPIVPPGREVASAVPGPPPAPPGAAVAGTAGPPGGAPPGRVVSAEAPGQRDR